MRPPRAQDQLDPGGEARDKGGEDAGREEGGAIRKAGSAGRIVEAGSAGRILGAHDLDEDERLKKGLRKRLDSCLDDDAGRGV